MAEARSIEQAAQEFTVAAETKSHADAAALGLSLLDLCRTSKNHDALVQYLPAVQSAAQRASLGGRALVIEGRSLRENLGKPDDAKRVFNSVLTGYAEDPEACAAALIQRASIEQIEDRAPRVALSTYDEVIHRYSTTSHLPQAYLGKMRAGRAALDADAVVAGFAGLEERFPRTRPLAEGKWELADFHLEASGNRERAHIALAGIVEASVVPTPEMVEARAEFDRRLLSSINLPSMQASTQAKTSPAPAEASVARDYLSRQDELVAKARIRLADEFHRGLFDQAIREYEAILAEYPSLSQADKDWCRVQIGLYQYQLRKNDLSLGTFTALSQERRGSLSPALQEVVDLHIRALQDQNSTQSIVAWFDRGYRWRQTPGMRDLCWQEWHQWWDHVEKSPSIAAYIADPSVSPDDRADMVWRKAMVLWEIHHDHSDICSMANKILDEIKPSGIMAQKAKFLKAYHHAHSGDYGTAAKYYREILEERPDSIRLVPDVYTELLWAHRRGGQDLDAALVAEEFRILYPYRWENQTFQQVHQRIVEEKPDLSSSLQQAAIQLRTKLMRGRENFIPIALDDTILPSRALPRPLAMMSGK